MSFPHGEIGFRNPVIGGDGELVIDNIHSRNYVAGVSGWEIDRDGSAEFNDVTVRGEFEITGADGSFIRGSSAGGTASIQESPPTLAGTTWSPGSLTTFLEIADVPVVALSSPKDVDAVSSGSSIHFVGPTPNVEDSLIRHYAHRHQFFELDGVDTQVEINGTPGGTTALLVLGEIEMSGLKVNGPVMAATGVWTDFTFNAGYSSLGTAGYDPQWRWLSETTVQTRGVIKKGTGAGGAGANGFSATNSPMTIPLALRPSEIVNVACPCQPIAPNFAVCEMRIDPSGAVTFETAAAHHPGWVELDAIYDVI